ncbi:DNA translocase FtsK [Helicobacter muridarum]|uniref:DNA translocase FtsK n=1 Tax=Helicobacter muridarum TaxID=216 RepID=A0A377PRS4_9HELI|nr:DNA translocase FtsK [Helicobacter muridarum]TLE00204.1 DNA translocase FtsK [Helicobacter muridarum]STQ85688.1 putative DNA segregation ATPase [Helicobacter muridarum]
MFAFISCLILFLWITIILGYTDPNIGLQGTQVQNKFFKIDGFGNKFAIFNVQAFGYIAYIYLPLLLFPLYKLYDNTEYSFRKIQLTFATLLFFLSLLILQSLIFGVGILGNGICNMLMPYIGTIGVVILVLLLMCATFFMTWRRSISFMQKYLSARIGMSIDSWKSSIIKIQTTLKKIKLNYIQKRSKKTFSSEYSERQTTTNNKYAFKEPLIEKPLDEMTPLDLNHREIEYNSHDIWYDNAKIPLVQNNIKAKVQEANNQSSMTEANNKISPESNTKQAQDANNIKYDNAMSKILFNPKKDSNKTMSTPHYNISSMEQKVDTLTKDYLPRTQDIYTKADDLLKRFHKLSTNKDNIPIMPIDEQMDISAKYVKPAIEESTIKSFSKPVEMKLDSKNLQPQPKTVEVLYSEGTNISSIKKQVKLKQDNTTINPKILPNIELSIKQNIEESPKTINKSHDEQAISNQIKYSATKIQPKMESKIGHNLESANQTRIDSNVQNITKPSIIYTQANQRSNSIFTTNEQNKTKSLRKPYIHTYTSPISSETNKNDVKQTTANDIGDSFTDLSDEDLLLDGHNSTNNESCPIYIESTSSPIEILANHSYNQNENEEIKPIDKNIKELNSKDSQTQESNTLDYLKDINNKEAIQSINQDMHKQEESINLKDTKDVDNSKLDIQISDDTKKKLYNKPLVTEENINKNHDNAQNTSADSNNYETYKKNETNNDNKPNLTYTQSLSENNDKLNISEHGNSNIQITPIITPQQGIQEIAKQFLPNNEITKNYISNQTMPSIDLKSMNSNLAIAPIPAYTTEQSKETKEHQIDNTTNQYAEVYTKQHHNSNKNIKANKSMEQDILNYDLAQNDYINNNKEPNISNTQVYDNIKHNNAEHNQIQQDKTQKYDGMQEYKFPPLSLLQLPKHQEEIQDIEIDSKIANLLNKLHVFKIRGDIVRVFTGPVVTTFEFRPEPDVKVNKVQSLQDDLAMALKAKSIRIQAPIPGKDVIGIEIPNGNAQTIYLRDVLESSAFLHSANPLSITLGKDIMGNIVIENLAKLPHLLVAGTTGSGKSVGVNALILSLLYRNSPDDLKLMMIDPKQVEFAPYEDLPHLITPIINAPDKAVQALYAATVEMDKRYKILSDAKMKNIHSYNEKSESSMPFFVIVIDELADLIMTGGKDAEASITRIAQMGRAAGMHLIVATQRSSVDVVTGLIKTNLPSRISYRVGNKTDSKVILDEFGAERLLGNGDGLFKSVDSLKRIHAPWVSEQEIESIVYFIKQQRPVQYDANFLSEQKQNNAGFIDKISADSGLLEEAKAIILRDNKASISNLQRRLSIGYNKAATLIEALQAEGFVSAPNTKGERSILSS